MSGERANEALNTDNGIIKQWIKTNFRSNPHAQAQSIGDYDFLMPASVTRPAIYKQKQNNTDIRLYNSENACIGDKCDHISQISE
jgi:hypothetical protein